MSQLHVWYPSQTVRTDPSQRTLQESFLTSWMKQSNTYLQRPALPEGKLCHVSETKDLLLKPLLTRTACADDSSERSTEARGESEGNGETRSEAPSSSQQWSKTNPLLTEIERVVNDGAPSTQLWWHAACSSFV